MIQTIQGRKVYVVEFDTMPKLPIEGQIEETLQYNHFIQRLFWGTPVPTKNMTYGKSMYTTALNLAFETGVIAEPGKYAIYVDPKANTWDVFRVIE